LRMDLQESPSPPPYLVSWTERNLAELHEQFHESIFEAGIEIPPSDQ
jgi:hypothetical protein